MFVRLPPFAVAVCALACSACGNSSGLYPVSGTVLYNGEPAVGANVTFLKKDAIGHLNQTPLGAVVGPDGTFTLAGPDGEGAIPGEYIVLIEWKEGAGKVPGRSPALSAPDRLNKKYLNAQEPLLMTTVEAKTNRLPAFELK
jgi:hypothetical protein